MSPMAPRAEAAEAAYNPMAPRPGDFDEDESKSNGGGGGGGGGAPASPLPSALRGRGGRTPAAPLTPSALPPIGLGKGNSIAEQRRQVMSYMQSSSNAANAQFKKVESAPLGSLQPQNGISYLISQSEC